MRSNSKFDLQLGLWSGACTCEQKECSLFPPFEFEFARPISKRTCKQFVFTTVYASTFHQKAHSHERGHDFTVSFSFGLRLTAFAFLPFALPALAGLGGCLLAGSGEVLSCERFRLEPGD